MSTIDITPAIAPQRWRDALAARGIEGIVVDERGRFQIIDQARVVRTLIGDLMVAHVERTMVLPSHADALRRQIAQVRELGALDKGAASEAAERIVAQLEATIAVLEGGAQR